MDRTFSNTDAAICGGIALAELIFLFVWVAVTSARLRNKVISMGRLIPTTVQMVVVGGIAPGIISGYPNPYPGQHPQQPTLAQMPPPPPPDYNHLYDAPPPYSEQESSSNKNRH